MRLLLLWMTVLGGCAAALAEGVPWGETNITPNTLFKFEPPLSLQSKYVVTRVGNPAVEKAKAAIVCPEGFTVTNIWPIVVVSASSDAGSNLAVVRSYTNAANGLGWVVLAAEGPNGKPPKDDATWRWQMIHTALEEVYLQWPAAKRWPLAFAGFSGGAKWSTIMASIAVKEKLPVRGVFLGGCNEDLASESLKLYRVGEEFKHVRFLISSGTSDPIATPAQQSSMFQSMRKTGFNQLRFESYDGSHRMHEDHLKSALEWFAQPESGGDSTPSSR